MSNSVEMNTLAMSNPDLEADAVDSSGDKVIYVWPLISLFWTFGDVCPGFH